MRATTGHAATPMSHERKKHPFSEHAVVGREFANGELIGRKI
jgi:hypothetical protein